MRRHVRLTLAVLAIATPALVAAGCGGDDEGGGGDGTTTVTALTADAWRTQADAICADIDARGKALGTPSSPAEFGSFVEKAKPLLEEQITRFKKLVPPTELESIQSQAIALQEQRVKILDDVQKRLAGGEDPTAVVSSIDFDSADNQLDKLAADAGLKNCGSDDDSTTTDATTDSTTTEATTTDSGVTVPTTGDAQVDKFLGDVKVATDALTTFGQGLQSIANPDQLKSELTDLRSKLGEFDQAIGNMADYTLDNATLEGQRSRLVEAGPKVSDTLREFIDVASSVDGPEDLSKLTTVLPKVSTALTDFAQAAQPK